MLLIGKSTISMAMFSGQPFNYHRVWPYITKYLIGFIGLSLYSKWLSRCVFGEKHIHSYGAKDSGGSLRNSVPLQECMFKTFIGKSLWSKAVRILGWKGGCAYVNYCDFLLIPSLFLYPHALYTIGYWVGGLSRLTLCKVDSKWCALWEKHDKVSFLAILIFYMFMFDVVCAVFSSCQVPTCGTV